MMFSNSLLLKLIWYLEFLFSLFSAFRGCLHSSHQTQTKNLAFANLHRRSDVEVYFKVCQYSVTSRLRAVSDAIQHTSDLRVLQSTDPLCRSHVLCFLWRKKKSALKTKTFLFSTLVNFDP